MNLEKLRQQIRIEQLRYLYNDDLIPQISGSLHWSTSHIPNKYVFNNARRRLKSRPHSQDFLYCKPFFVWHKHHKLYSHKQNGKFVREAIKCLPETEVMLLELTRMVMSKGKFDYRNQSDFFNDAYCTLLQKFREVDTNRPAPQVFNYVLSIGINSLKNIRSDQRKWDYYHHELHEYI